MDLMIYIFIHYNELVVRQRVYNTNSSTASSGQVATSAFNVTKSGYIALCVQTYYNGNRNLFPYSVAVGQIQNQNNTSSSQTISVGAAYQDIIYIKEAYYTNLGG